MRYGHEVWRVVGGGVVTVDASVAASGLLLYFMPATGQPDFEIAFGPGVTVLQASDATLNSASAEAQTVEIIFQDDNVARVVSVEHTYKTVLDWCACDGVTNDTPAFVGMLTELNGAPARIPAGTVVKLDTAAVYTGPVNISGDGVIQHTRLGGLSVSQPLTALGAVAAITTVSAPAGFASANTTHITLAAAPPASVVRGRVLLVSSDDQLAEQPGAFRGELGRVLSVSGATITLAGLFEFTYSAAVVCHMLSDTPVKIQARFSNPTYLTDNSPQAGPALLVVNAADAELDIKTDGQATAAVQTVGCWAPKISLVANNSRNDHVNSSYGYGVVLSGATAFAAVKAQGTSNRHLISGGANANSLTGYRGAPRHNTIYDSLAIDPLSTGFDTHEAMYHTRFVDCWVRKNHGNIDYVTENTLFDFADRGAGTQLINCGSHGNGGVRLGGAGYLRSGAAGKYTTRLIGHKADVDVFSAGIGLVVASAVNAATAAQHEVEIENSRLRRTVVTINSLAPRVTIDGLDLREQDGSMSLGSNNTVRIRRLVRRRAAGNLPNVLVGPGTNVTVEDYTAEATAFSNGALIRATGGAGTATVRFGRVYTPGATPAEVANSDGTTLLAASLLGAALRPVAIGATTARPVLGAFEIGQQYIDTTLSPAGTPITWTGSAWVNASGTAV
jgi:hypothetical protein